MIARSLTSSVSQAVSESRSSRWALAGLSLSVLASSLSTSIANAGLPSLARSFGAPFQSVQWVVLAYLLAVTALSVSAGHIGDRVGRRKLLIVGISIYTISSFLCGIAPSLGLLIATRAAQGLGASIMMALSVSFVFETTPKNQTGSAMGLIGTMSAIGTAAGPSLGGFLLSLIGWQAIFLISVPLGLLALHLVLRYLPKNHELPVTDRSTFDFPGTTLLILSLASYALAMTLGRGQMGITNAVFIAVALLMAGAFILVESRTNSPVLKFEVFKDGSLTLGLIESTLVSTVVMSTMVVGPFYLTRGLGLDSMNIGLILSIGPIVVAVAGIPSGKLADNFGARRIALLGLIAMATGCFTFAMTSPAYGIPGYVFPIVVLTAGYALFQTSNNSAVLTSTSSDQRGLISGMLSLSRNIGLMTGASAMGAVFALGAKVSDITVASPEAVTLGMRLTFGVATVLTAIAFGFCLTIRTTSARNEGSAEDIGSRSPTTSRAS